MESDEPEEKKSKLLQQIRTWQIRADMALKVNNQDLYKQALERKNQFENELSKLQEFEL